MLRPIFTLLRKMFPILVIGKRALVTRHADVVEVLTRDTDFTIAEINEARINRADGPFILGMDRSPQYDTEAAALREVVRPDDLERIRSLVKQNATDLVAAARYPLRTRVHNLERFVTVRGGAYFFLPSIRALRYLARL